MALPHLPQAQDWIANVFNGNRREFEKFLTKHRKSGMMTFQFSGIIALVLGTFTDIDGIVCAATCIYIGNFKDIDMKLSLTIFSRRKRHKYRGHQPWWRNWVHHLEGTQCRSWQHETFEHRTLLQRRGCWWTLPIACLC